LQYIFYDFGALFWLYIPFTLFLLLFAPIMNL
jgi:hypothetical protein